MQGGVAGEGNIDADPMFSKDFHLTYGSPCIDVGDNSVVGPDAVDMDGEERIQDEIVDMGADESHFCLGDFDSDGHIGAFDLAVLLGAWGSCPEPPALCLPDLEGSGDGIVGAGDLAVLLGNWGPCD